MWNSGRREPGPNRCCKKFAPWTDSSSAGPRFPALHTAPQQLPSPAISLDSGCTSSHFTNLWPFHRLVCDRRGVRLCLFQAWPQSPWPGPMVFASVGVNGAVSVLCHCSAHFHLGMATGFPRPRMTPIPTNAERSREAFSSILVPVGEFIYMGKLVGNLSQQEVKYLKINLN